MKGRGLMFDMPKWIDRFIAWTLGISFALIIMAASALVLLSPYLVWNFIGQYL